MNEKLSSFDTTVTNSANSDRAKVVQPNVTKDKNFQQMIAALYSLCYAIALFPVVIFALARLQHTFSKTENLLPYFIAGYGILLWPSAIICGLLGYYDARKRGHERAAQVALFSLLLHASILLIIVLAILGHR